MNHQLIKYDDKFEVLISDLLIYKKWSLQFWVLFLCFGMDNKIEEAAYSSQLKHFCCLGQPHLIQFDQKVGGT
jgi:hypothetical protein